jgi:polyisoprenoid-binding protein YceI
MRLLIACLLAAMTAPAFAQPRAAPAWIVDGPKSNLGFDSSLAGVRFSGGFRRWDAAIAFDSKDLAASSASVIVDLASAGSGQKERDEVLPTPDWFATAKFPRATYVTTSIRAAGKDRYLATGMLTMKGVSRPVSLPFALTLDHGVATMTGSLPIDRTHWGVGLGQFAGDDLVPHIVTLKISIVARRKG